MSLSAKQVKAEDRQRAQEIKARQKMQKQQDRIAAKLAKEQDKTIQKLRKQVCDEQRRVYSQEHCDKFVSYSIKTTKQTNFQPPIFSWDKSIIILGTSDGTELDNP